EGAAIEPVEPDGLEVLAPEPVRNVLGWAEFARLGFAATRPVGAIPIGLEGEWLRRFGALLGARCRFAERRAARGGPVAAPTDPQCLLDRALDLPNAVWRLHDAKPTWTRCLLLAFRYTAISDEKREGLVWLGFNQGTGAVMDHDFLRRLRAHLASVVEWQVPEPDIRRAAGVACVGEMVTARVERLVEHHVRRDLEPFLNAMRRRLDRDRGRVHGYHNDLR